MAVPELVPSAAKVAIAGVDNVSVSGPEPDEFACARSVYVPPIGNGPRFTTVEPAYPVLPKLVFSVPLASWVPSGPTTLSEKLVMVDCVTEAANARYCPAAASNVTGTGVVLVSVRPMLPPLTVNAGELEVVNATVNAPPTDPVGLIKT